MPPIGLNSVLNSGTEIGGILCSNEGILGSKNGGGGGMSPAFLFLNTSNKPIAPTPDFQRINLIKSLWSILEE